MRAFLGEIIDEFGHADCGVAGFCDFFCYVFCVLSVCFFRAVTVDQRVVVVYLGCCFCWFFVEDQVVY